jgi:hypothetical protein
VDPTKFQDWLRIRSKLLELEAGFTDLAVCVASGQGTGQELQAARHELEAVRELSTLMYREAFPELAEHS